MGYGLAPAPRAGGRFANRPYCTLFVSHPMTGSQIAKHISQILDHRITRVLDDQATLGLDYPIAYRARLRFLV